MPSRRKNHAVWSPASPAPITTAVGIYLPLLRMNGSCYSAAHSCVRRFLDFSFYTGLCRGIAILQKFLFTGWFLAWNNQVNHVEKVSLLRASGAIENRICCAAGDGRGAVVPPLYYRHEGRV